jgi:hypothetical protein
MVSGGGLEALLVFPFNMKWRCYMWGGGVEESKFCLFLVFFPVRCISSVSPRFYFKRHAFCFLPLAAILESLPSLIMWSKGTWNIRDILQNMTRVDCTYDTISMKHLPGVLEALVRALFSREKHNNPKSIHVDPVVYCIPGITAPK